MSGHVFIVHGDITRIACDAWLLPGGPDAGPGQSWLPAVAPHPAEPLPQSWPNKTDRIVRWAKLSETDPEPFLAHVGGSHRTPVAWYVEAVEQFFERATAFLKNKPPKNKRARHLLALPLVGTGQGGKRRQAGAVARELLPALYAFTEREEVDVALVMIEGAAYSAAQSVRKLEIGTRAWTNLEAHLLKKADRLARIAGSRGLVLFLGAGVGASAGLPLWGSLLDELAQKKAKMPEHVRQQLWSLSALDRAHIIEGRMEEGESLSIAVAELLIARSKYYSLPHALLAALPVDEVVTTNYDTLFEAASSAVNRPVTVLPYTRLSEGRRWLLKMHGCVTHPEDIVLTRENYLAYRERREALAGIVQALLITRHMLFIGFSLEDDNFHQIVRAVRRAIRVGGEEEQPAAHQFGTSLMISDSPLTEELWRGSLQWIALESARRLDIFLDRLGASASEASAHLFDPRYDEILTAGEKEVRDSLRALFSNASDQAKDTHAFSRIIELMKELGWKKT